MWNGHTGRMLLFGLGMLLCLTALTLLYLNVPQGFQQPRFWAPRRNHSVEVSALYREALYLHPIAIPVGVFRWVSRILLIAICGLYVGAICSVKGQKLSWPILCITWLIVMALWIMPPLYATDVFYYSIVGQIAGEFGTNPYIRTPSEFPQSSLLRYNYWVHQSTVYGPAWTLLSAAVTFVSGSNPLVTTLLFKFIGALSVIAAAGLIWSLLRATSPSHAAQGTLIFLWNPVVLLEGIANAHNDVVVMTLVVVAALAVYRMKFIFGYISLLLAVFVKYLAAPVIACYVVSLLSPKRASTRDRWITAVLLGSVGILFTVLLWAPYWEGLQTLSSIFGFQSVQQNGVIATIIIILGRLFNISSPIRSQIAIIGSLVALFAVLIWVIQRFVFIWRQSDTYSFTDEISTWAYTSLLIPITLVRAHPWYLLTALALFAVVAPRSRKGALVTYVLATAWFIYRVCY